MHSLSRLKEVRPATITWCLMLDSRVAVQYLNVGRVVVDSDTARFECAFDAHSASLNGSVRTWLVEEQRPDKGKPCWHCAYKGVLPWWCGTAGKRIPTPLDCRAWNLPFLSTPPPGLRLGAILRASKLETHHAHAANQAGSQLVAAVGASCQAYLKPTGADAS